MSSFYKTIKNTLCSSSFLRANFLVFFIVNLGNVFNYLFQLVMGKLLSPHDYGTMNALFSLAVIAFAPFTVIPPVVANFTASYSAKNDFSRVTCLTKYSFYSGLGLGIAMFFLGLLFTSHIENYLKIKKSLYVWISIAQVATGIFSLVLIGALQGLRRFLSYSISLSSFPLSKFLLGILLVGVFNLGLIGALMSPLIANIFPLVLSLFFLKEILFSKEVCDFKEMKKIFKQMLIYSFPVAIAYIGLALLSSTDMLMVKHYFSAKETGMYSAAVVIGKIAYFLPYTVITVLFPVVSAEHAKGQNTLKFLLISLGLIFLISGSIVFTFWTFPKFTIGILIGEKYIPAYSILKIVGFSMMFLAFITAVVNYSLAKRNWRFLYPLVIGVLVEPLIIFFNHKTLEAVALSVLGVSLLLFLTMLFMGYFQIGRPSIKKFLLNGIKLWFAGIILLFPNNNLKANALLVEGDIDMLVPLSYTYLLDNAPAIFFSEQIGNKGWFILDKVNKIIITDNVEGMALDFMYKTPQFAKNGWRVSFTSGKIEKIFKIPEEGIYELWLKFENGDNLIKGIIKFQIDKKHYGKKEIEPSFLSTHWIKLGAINLSEGKHKLVLNSIFVPYKTKILLVIVKKEILAKCVKVIKKFPLSKLVTLPPENNIFKLTIPKSGTYRPVFYFYPGFISNGFTDVKWLYSIPQFLKLPEGSLNLLSQKFDKEEINCSARISKTKEGDFIIRVNPKYLAQEFIELKLKYFFKKKVAITDINTENLVFLLTFKVSNPLLQKISVIFWVNSYQREKDGLPPIPIKIEIPEEYLRFSQIDYVSWWIDIKKIIDISEFDSISRIDVLLKVKKNKKSYYNDKRVLFKIKNMGLLFYLPPEIKITSSNKPKLPFEKYIFLNGKKIETTDSLSDISRYIKTAYKIYFAKNNKLTNLLFLKNALCSVTTFNFADYIINFYFRCNSLKKVEKSFSVPFFVRNWNISLKTLCNFNKLCNCAISKIILEEKDKNGKKLKWKYVPFILTVKKFNRISTENLSLKDFPIFLFNNQIIRPISFERVSENLVRVVYENIDIKEGFLNIKTVFNKKKWYFKLLFLEANK